MLQRYPGFSLNFFQNNDSNAQKYHPAFLGGEFWSCNRVDIYL